MEVAALAGGVGGAKLLVGLQRAATRLTAIVNTGDDDVIYGVHVSPDIDIVTYWLAGMADTERGWGLKDDTFSVVDALGRLGHADWFRLGDRDFATCLHRTTRLADGESLSAITADIAASLGVDARVLPMSDDPVRTQLVTDDGRTLSFQDYFVRERTEPDVVEVLLAGIEAAKPAPGVVEAIGDADRVVLCPSNPYLSIGPILALPGVRDALREHSDVMAVSPIISGTALKGPADRLLRSLRAEVSAVGVARLYADLCNTFVLDSADEKLVPQIEELGIRALVRDSVMSDARASERLARELVA